MTENIPALFREGLVRGKSSKLVWAKADSQCFSGCGKYWVAGRRATLHILSRPGITIPFRQEWIRLVIEFASKVGHWN